MMVVHFSSKVHAICRKGYRKTWCYSNRTFSVIIWYDAWENKINKLRFFQRGKQPCDVCFGFPFHTNDLASASCGCQFVYTGEEAYRQEAVCACRVRGLSFWRAFLSVRCRGSGELLMSADPVRHGVRRKEKKQKRRFRCYVRTRRPPCAHTQAKNTDT